MTVTGIQGPCGGSFKATWTTGVIPGPGTQNTTITFAPSTPQDCSGTVTVAADFTSGTNTLPVNAVGTLDGVPLFSRSGFGNTVFNVPTYVTKLRITGTYFGFTSNFIVWGGPNNAACGSAIVSGCILLVNDLIGTAYGKTVDDGTYLTNNQPQINIIDSSGVSWTITESR
jgi:hypothetical protein